MVVATYQRNIPQIYGPNGLTNIMKESTIYSHTNIMKESKMCDGTSVPKESKYTFILTY